MRQKVVVDLEDCIGCGTCRSLCPKVFALQGDPRKCLIKDPGGDPECVEFAISMCPTEAIIWQES